jgi:NADH-quinone oxidoreductase subunit M
VEKNIKPYFALLLLLQGSIYGVFFSLDFFLFYVFWEVMLIPMYFLIALWGGENREYAATKFILYTFAGSILMLVGVIALYYVSGKNPDSFDIIALQGGKFKDITFSLLGGTYSFENFFFWILFLGFAIKVPLFPFHTWLPHAHVQAPTAVSVILAGVLLKMGAYGFIRIAFPIFPNAAQEYAQIIAFLGLISIIYGAFCALAQTDVKKLIAYSSVSHMGFVMLGLSSFNIQGVNGAVMQMFNHGTSTAMMFLLVGMIYDRSHHRWIIKPDGTRGFSGLAIHMPIYTIIFLLGMFASIGLPGLSGFVSEFLIMMGAFKVFPLFTTISVVGLLFGAAYLLWMYKRMFFGEVSPEVKSYSDISKLEIGYMIPLCALVILLGVVPSPLANLIKASVGEFVLQMSK